MFLHPKTGRNLQRPSISLRLCKLIEQACPGSLPRGHDGRKQATSLAWSRGMPPADIIDAGFWSSSSTFLKFYLNTGVNSTQSCIALGTQ